MQPCLELNQLENDFCCWGRRPTVPIELYTFCPTHAPHFLQYLLDSYFTHAAKKALFVSTHDTFYVVFRLNLEHYQVVAWKAKALPLTPITKKKPLHFRRATSGLMTVHSVLELFQSLLQFQLSCVIQTPLDIIDALKHVHVPLVHFDVKRLQFDPVVPAFVISTQDFVLPDVLSAPFVMLLNGSTTPDPRLYNSGTQNLWSTLTGNKLPLANLRYGVLLQQTKTVETENGGSTATCSITGIPINNTWVQGRREHQQHQHHQHEQQQHFGRGGDNETKSNNYEQFSVDL
jgi:hypothetical protein